ncbi:hypothetical protein U1Q18_016425 [Sarracenia purpurea var. burkii]
MVDQGISYTLDEALNTIRFGKCRGHVLAYAGLGWSAEAMGVMLLPFAGPAVKSEWGLSPGEESRITTVLKVCSYPRQMHLDGCLSSFLVPRDSFQAALAWIAMTDLGRKWLVALSPLPEDLNGEILLSEDIHLLTRGPKKTEDSETSSSSTLALKSGHLNLCALVEFISDFDTPMGPSLKKKGLVLETGRPLRPAISESILGNFTPAVPNIISGGPRCYEVLELPTGGRLSQDDQSSVMTH